MLRKKAFWIVLVVAAALGGGGYYLYSTQVAPAQAQATDTPLQTAQVRRGELVISASGVGTVIPAAEISVGFASSGLVEAIYVQVGDLVEAGDVLAQQGNLDQLELAVLNAELALSKAQSAIQALYDGLDLERAQTASAVAEAQAALEDASAARTLMDGGRCNEEIVEEYYFAWLEAKDYVEKLERWDWPTGDMISEAAVERDRLYITYAWCNTPFSEQEKGAADAAIALAQAELAEAQASLEKIQAGPDASAIDEAQVNVTIAESELAIAKENLASATLTAPISGTVMEVSAQVGETTGASFITIADLAVPMLEIFLDETDLAMAGEGYEVEVTFDALTDQTFIGHILSVDPSLTESGMTKVVRALVELDEGTFSKAQRLPVGLSASVEVIGSRAEDAVLVPVEALRDLGDGEYAVFVMEGGEPKLRMVAVGIMDYTYAQVLSGLEAGETVTTGIVETE